MDLFNEDGPLKTVPAQLRLPHGREKVHRPAIVSRVCVGLFRRHTRPGTCEPQKHAKDPPDSHGMLVRGSLVLVCPHRTGIRVLPAVSYGRIHNISVRARRRTQVDYICVHYADLSHHMFWPMSRLP